MTLDKELIYIGGVVGALITIWKGVDMVRRSGERHQELIDTIKALQKNEQRQDEVIKELDRKVDLLLIEVASIKERV